MINNIKLELSIEKNKLKVEQKKDTYLRLND